MVSGEPFLDMMICQRILLFYKVDSYRKGEFLKVKKVISAGENGS